MNNLLVRFEEFVRNENLFRLGHRLLVTVSGGVDSVVLARLCRSAGYHIEIAHCNFQLRGEESLRDEEYTSQFAGIINAPIHIKRFDTTEFAEKKGVSIQEAARELRYAWFRELAEELRMDRIITAHHADDNIETMLMNLFKGTGIAGLRGILPLQGNLARPLLFASRNDIEAYAQDHGIGYVEDSSNLSDKYSRNYIRHHVIPLIGKLYPGVINNLYENVYRFRETEQLFRESVELRFKTLLVHKGEEVHIPVEKLRITKPLRTILYELFTPAGFSTGQLNEIIKLMDAPTGKYIQSATHTLIKNRNWFILAPITTESLSLITIDSQMEEVRMPGGRLTFRITENSENFHLENDPAIATIDFSQLQFPLTLRKWKEGDYFYPLGMRKKKKIARFLIDQKLSKTEKENQWVLLSGDRIIWLVGRRIDDRFKIKSATLQILIITKEFR